MSGYSEGAASKTRPALKSWTPRHLSAKGDVEYNLKTLRERASDLAINSPLGSAVVETMTSGVIGEGLKLFPRVQSDVVGLTPAQARELNKKIKREFELWSSEPRFCDYLYRNNFAELQQILFRSMLTDGDSFVLFKRRMPTAYNPYSLRLQAIDGLRVSNPDNSVEMQRGRHRLINGIELDADGALSAVHIANRLWNEPTATAEPLKWQRVRWFGRDSGCRNVLQICKDARPDQCRGVPLLAPVIESLKQLSRFNEAELGAAIVRSFFSVFFTQKERDLTFNQITGKAATEEAEVDVKEFKLDSPSVTSLPAGVDVKFLSNNAAQSEFAEFTTAFIKQVGAAVNLPCEVLLKTFNSSYSASRAALLQAENEFRQRRRAFVVDFCQPIYELFLQEAVALGRIDAPGFDEPLKRQAYLNAQWINEKANILDPLKEAQASVLKLEHGLTTYEKVLAEQGLNFEDVAEQLEQEKKMRPQAIDD